MFEYLSMYTLLYVYIYLYFNHTKSYVVLMIYPSLNKHTYYIIIYMDIYNVILYAPITHKQNK